MKKEHWERLEQHLPEIFEPYKLIWPSGVTVSSEFSFEKTDHEFSNSGRALNKKLKKESIIDEPINLLTRKPIKKIYQSLTEIFENLPDWSGKLTSNSETNVPDRFAFYLPRHHFPDWWGIYLIYEGVQELADIFKNFSNQFDKADRLYLARTYLYYHEAYHNVIEMFTTRQEISHRSEIYKVGEKYYYKQKNLKEYHEDALADAYAAYHVKKYGFKDDRDKKEKRDLAFKVLSDYIETRPEPYRSATKILTNEFDFKDRESLLLEKIMTKSVNIPPRDHGIWQSSTNSMTPSFRLTNGAFRYIIASDDPKAKIFSEHVRNCDRKKFLKKISEYIDCKIVPGGKHPILLTGYGKRIPIPMGQLATGTANSILDQLGLKDRFGNWKNFMSA